MCEFHSSSQAGRDRGRLVRDSSVKSLGHHRFVSLMNKETTGTGYTTSREKLGRPKPREISSQPARRPERTDRAQAMVANAYA